MTKLNHCGIGYFKAITAYLYSILGKYIPGKVFMLLARIPAYEEEGGPYPQGDDLLLPGEYLHLAGSSLSISGFTAVLSK